MTRKTTKYCLSWPNKTLEISRRLRNITILLTERTIMSHSNLILPLSPLFHRMWRHFLVDDPNTKKVPGVTDCSPPPLVMITGNFACFRWFKSRIFAILRSHLWKLNSNNKSASSGLAWDRTVQSNKERICFLQHRQHFRFSRHMRKIILPFRFLNFCLQIWTHVPDLAN